MGLNSPRVATLATTLTGKIDKQNHIGKQKERTGFKDIPAIANAFINVQLCLCFYSIIDDSIFL